MASLRPRLRLCITYEKAMSQISLDIFLKTISPKHRLPLLSYFPDFCPVDFVFGVLPALPGLFCGKPTKFQDFTSFWDSVGVWGRLESRAPRCGLLWGGRPTTCGFWLWSLAFWRQHLLSVPSPICVGRQFSMAFLYLLDCLFKDVWRANDFGS